jgi:hypothetical protein
MADEFIKLHPELSASIVSTCVSTTIQLNQVVSPQSFHEAEGDPVRQMISLEGCSCPVPSGQSPGQWRDAPGTPSDSIRVVRS